MSACYCDYEPAELYWPRISRSRVERRCDECNKPIRVGERYERVRARWEGDWGTFCTCARCLALRDYVTAHVPCVCWAHGNLLEDCMATVEDWSSEAPGLWFGAARLRIAIRRHA